MQGKVTHHLWIMLQSENTLSIESSPILETSAVHTIISASYANRTFSVAYFDSESKLLRIMEDLPEYDNYLILSQCIVNLMNGI